MPGPPLRPAREATFTMEPPPLSLRWGTPYLTPRKQDRGLTRMSRSHSDSSKSVIAPDRWAPALLTITSMPHRIGCRLHQRPHIFRLGHVGSYESSLTVLAPYVGDCLFGTLFV